MLLLIFMSIECIVEVECIGVVGDVDMNEI